MASNFVFQRQVQGGFSGVRSKPLPTPPPFFFISNETKLFHFIWYLRKMRWMKPEKRIPNPYMHMNPLSRNPGSIPAFTRYSCILHWRNLLLPFVCYWIIPSVLIQWSGGSRGGSGGSFEPPPRPLFLNILWKLNILVSVRPNYFISMWYLREMRSNQRREPPHLYIHLYTYDPLSRNPGSAPAMSLCWFIC